MKSLPLPLGSIFTGINTGNRAEMEEIENPELFDLFHIPQCLHDEMRSIEGCQR